ncbi:MAG: potassium channel protein [Bacteroidales bacterium]|nr:potassium channel protein [Bacteroidales bacterium]
MNPKRLLYLYFSAVALLLVIGVGIVGFMLIEKYSLIEAFYMTMITVSTVGFEEVRQLSQEGMIFTSFLIIISFGVFAYFITNSTKFMMDGEFRLYLKKRKMEKDLKNLKQHVIVCGFGRNGRQAVIELLLHNEKTLVIEKDAELVENDSNSEILKNKNFRFVQGDAVQEDFLFKAKISDAKALITTLPSDADNLFIVLTARQLNSSLTIISRASEDHSDIKLKRAGATNVIMPDKIGGSRMAILVAQPDIVEFLDSILIGSGIDVNLVEIQCREIDAAMMNKTISELNIRKISGANLIGIKRADNTFVYNPSVDIRLTAEDKLFVIGSSDQVGKLKWILTGNN